jgi:hypothetical protein
MARGRFSRAGAGTLAPPFSRRRRAVKSRGGRVLSSRGSLIDPDEEIATGGVTSCNPTSRAGRANGAPCAF